MAASATKTGNLFGALWAGTATANASGIATVAFPSGHFTQPPVVIGTGVTDSTGRDMAVCLVPGSLTKDGVQLQVRKSQIVSVATNTLDPFVPAAGAAVHVMARTAS